jgi:hypothetical protein
MRSNWRRFGGFLPVIVLGVMVGGCGSNTSPVIVSPIPTQASRTATVMAALPTTSPTAAPTEPTSTPAPTITRQIAQPAGGPSPTNPLGPTFTPAPPTLTATLAPTLVGMEIKYFTSTSELISPGDNVTLFWQVVGAERVTIYRLDAEGEPDVERPVESDGRITMRTDPENLAEARFLLVAERGTVVAEQELVIAVSCDTAAWFFTPSPGGCPTGPAVSSTHAQQRFEQGMLIWVQALDSIFVFYDDDLALRWLRLEDTFEEGMQEHDDTIVPPAGLYQPVRGFGLIWRTTPSVRERLGWAVEPEFAYNGIFQTAGQIEAEQIIYLRTADSSVLELAAGGVEWRVIPFDLGSETATPTPSSP